LGIGAFYLLLRLSTEPRTQIPSTALFIVGFVTGLGLLVEYPTIILALWFGLWSLLMGGWRKWLYYLAGFCVPVVALLDYHQALFHNPFATPYAYLANES